MRKTEIEEYQELKSVMDEYRDLKAILDVVRRNRVPDPRDPAQAKQTQKRSKAVRSKW